MAGISIVNGLPTLLSICAVFICALNEARGEDLMIGKLIGQGGTKQEALAGMPEHIREPVKEVKVSYILHRKSIL